MIFSYLLLLLFFIFINANEQYHIGVINPPTQWYIYCPQNNTRIINPPLNDQPIISYQCPSASLPIEIVPIEIDIIFLCHLQPRLIWIIVDVYQYNDWLLSIDSQQLNISITINQEIHIKDYESDIKNFRNRFIRINAFHIPFESLESLLNKKIEILIEINQCIFYINDNSTWNDIIQKNCNSIDSKKTLHIQYAQCDFFPKLIPIDTNNHLQVDILDDNTTNIPDFHVILSVDEQKQLMEATTRFPDYHLLFYEQYQKILSALIIIAKATNLLTFIFIFTIIIFILLIILFIYILCYHYHIRSIEKSSLLI